MAFSHVLRVKGGLLSSRFQRDGHVLLLGGDLRVCATIVERQPDRPAGMPLPIRSTRTGLPSKSRLRSLSSEVRTMTLRGSVRAVAATTASTVRSRSFRLDDYKPSGRGFEPHSPHFTQLRAHVDLAQMIKKWSRCPD